MAGAINHWLIHAGMSAGGTMLEPFTRPLTYEANKLAPTLIPSLENLVDMWVHDRIGSLAFDQWCEWHGAPMNVSGMNPHDIPGTNIKNVEALWKYYVWSKQEIPTVHEASILNNRKIIPDKNYDKLLKRLGYVDYNVRKDISNLRYEVPGPSDLVRFAVRHAFEPKLVKDFGFPDERDQGPFMLDIFHQCAGINYPILTGPLKNAVEAVTGKPAEEVAAMYAEVGLPEPTWADIYWWSHWVMPSATQGYQMLFRLRPDRLKDYDPPEAKGLNFSYDNLNLLLRANDYPPYYRKYLAAISYATPGIRFLRQLVSTGVFGKAEIVDTLRRQGYSPKHADVLAETVIRNDQQTRRKKIITDSKGAIEKFWSLGIITDDDFRVMLIQNDVLPDDADATVELAKTQLRFERVKKIVDVIKKQMVKGALSSDEARAQLLQLDLRSDRVDEYIQDWSLEVKHESKEISAEKAVRWACAGYIGLKDLHTRLTNLGYDPQDTAGFIAEAQACVADKIAKALAQQAKQEERNVRALKQAQRDAANAIKAAQASLARHGSPAQLRKWFCEGHISEKDVYVRLHFLGWPMDDITRLIGDCKSGKITKTCTIHTDGSVVCTEVIAPPIGGP